MRVVCPLTTLAAGSHLFSSCCFPQMMGQMDSRGMHWMVPTAPAAAHVPIMDASGAFTVSTTASCPTPVTVGFCDAQPCGHPPSNSPPLVVACHGKFADKPLAHVLDCCSTALLARGYHGPLYLVVKGGSLSSPVWVPPTTDVTLQQFLGAPGAAMPAVMLHLGSPPVALPLLKSTSGS